jgi:hypothetical protein
MKALTIMAAAEGGYVVIQDQQPGLYNTPLFAGPLYDCLHFIDRKFTEGAAQPKLNDDIPF